MGHTLTNRYIYGKTKSNPRASVGRRSANIIQQGKAKGKSRKHGQVSKHRRTGKNRQGKARQGKARQGKARQGKARQGQFRGLCRVAIARTYAIQYSAMTERKSKVYIV